MRGKKIATIATALIVCAGTMGYIPVESFDIRELTTNSVLEPGQIEVNSINFPDENFRNYILAEIDTNDNGIINYENVKQIDVSSKKISDLSGIEIFVNLENLICSSNQLTELNLKNNTNLKKLDCTSNQLETLNINNNTNLIYLNCSNNKLTNINIDNNTKLAELNCSKNLFESIDLSGNTTLKSLNISSCSKLLNINLNGCTKLNTFRCTENSILTDIDISDCSKLQDVTCNYNYKLNNIYVTNCTSLSKLECANNRLSFLDLEGCNALEEIDCHCNQIKELDLTKKVNLTSLLCSNNNISNLNLSNNTMLRRLSVTGNQITSLDLSNTKVASLPIFSALSDYNYNIRLNGREFHLSSLPGNFDVTKATNWKNATVEGNIITVEYPGRVVTYDYDIGIAKKATFKLTPVEWSLVMEKEDDEVFVDEYNFPDENFRRCVSLAADKNQDCILSVSEISALEELVVSGEGIKDTTGIEYFTNLIDFDCGENRENTKLDVSKNTKLKFLNCDYNNLTKLDVSQNTELLYLNCMFNELTELDISNNTKLQILTCLSNDIKTLNLGGCPKLRELDCDNNPINFLDLSANHSLEVISCLMTQLEYLNLSQCPNIKKVQGWPDKIRFGINSDILTISPKEIECEVELIDGKFDISNIKDLKVETIEKLQNCTINENIITITDETKPIIINYKDGGNNIHIITLIPTTAIYIPDEEKPTTETTITTTITATTTTTTTTTTTAHIPDDNLPEEPTTETTTAVSLILLPTLLGDANCDESLTIADAAAIFQSIGNYDKYALSEQGAVNADIYEPGSGITPLDAITIMQIEAGIL